MDDIQQVVIMTLTGVVLRAGFCDFENDGTFNPSTEKDLFPRNRHGVNKR